MSSKYAGSSSSTATAPATATAKASPSVSTSMSLSVPACTTSCVIPSSHAEGASALLQDLPVVCVNAFSNFDPHVPVEQPVPVYLPSASDISPSYYAIPVERKRCLIRALTARSSICGKRPPSSAPSVSTAAAATAARIPAHPSASSAVGRVNGVGSATAEGENGTNGISTAAATAAAAVAAVATAPEAKRPRWTALDRERKQACLRVALAAACKQPDAPHSLHALREAWARDPRAKQLVDCDVRRALAASVSKWTSHELREYLARAGLHAGAMARHEMARSVEAHITPDRSPFSTDRPTRSS